MAAEEIKAEVSSKSNRRNKNVTAIVRELAEPLASEQNVSLWDVEYFKEGSDWFLRITLDKPDGISINDCEYFHKAIEPLIDEVDPIEDSYYLQVSSPGIERELRLPEHFSFGIGEKVSVKLFAADPVSRLKRLTGILEAYDSENDTVTISDWKQGDSSHLVLKRSAISRITTVFDFKF